MDVAHSELTHEQFATVIEVITQYGTVALAAKQAGIAPGRLRFLIDNEPDLNAAVSDALELFRDAIRLQVLERATVGKSDAMLKLAAESFVPETFKPAPVDPKTRSRPSGLVLRSFDDEGNDRAAPVEAPSEEKKPESSAPPAPREPLQIAVYTGL